MWQTTQSQQDSILGPLLKYLGLPRWLSSKDSTCSAGDAGDLGSVPGGVRKIPWRRAWQPTPVFLPGESHAWTEEPGGPQSIGLQSQTQLKQQNVRAHAKVLRKEKILLLVLSFGCDALP